MTHGDPAPTALQALRRGLPPLPRGCCSAFRRLGFPRVLPMAPSPPLPQGGPGGRLERGQTEVLRGLSSGPHRPKWEPRHAVF